MFDNRLERYFNHTILTQELHWIWTIPLLGITGFEPVTSRLSVVYSKPTELNTHLRGRVESFPLSLNLLFQSIKKLSIKI